MKNIFTILIFIGSITVFGQQMTWEQWEKESTTNIRLLPKYGSAEKTKEQKKADKEFIETILKQDSTHRKGSDRFVNLGFQYLNRDIKTAMYRFNQAYLLDSTNTDIYWGFGAIYMTLGQYQKAKEQYEEGLKKAPENTHLLTDYGTYFMAQYYALEPIDKEIALQNLNSAINYMTQSYNLDPTDQNTLFKLSILYWIRDDCDNAWKYYDECKALGGQPIKEAYTKDLEKKCTRKRK
jgi:tetratricopeptide (TPR) repeat protein